MLFVQCFVRIKVVDEIAKFFYVLVHLAFFFLVKLKAV